MKWEAAVGKMSDQENQVFQDYKEQIRKQFLIPLHERNQQLKNRAFEEESTPRPDGEYQRDYTRILYSSSFRRLQGKMQLFGIQSDQFIRNRLTHSLEVAQIAKSIADQIGYEKEEIYIVEACSLAHDIGNPGYGHAGERFLNEIAMKFGGFEGNAQTMRILTTVEQKRGDFQGLNLTYRTLLGILKYYNKYNLELEPEELKKQKFIYDRDYELVQRILNETGIELRTLDVQIVDIADEIAYAAHDLEDGLRIGVLNVDEVLHDFCNLTEDKKSQLKLETIFEESKMHAGFKNPKIESAEFSKLYRKEITSKVINTLINDIGIVHLNVEQRKKRGTSHIQEIGFVNYSELASGLKTTIYKCVTNNDQVYAYENEGKYMMQVLFDFYLEKPDYLPSEYRAENILRQYREYYRKEEEKDLQKRLVIDYISGMMDQYLKTTYSKLGKTIEQTKYMHPVKG